MIIIVHTIFDRNISLKHDIKTYEIPMKYIYLFSSHSPILIGRAFRILASLCVVSARDTTYNRGDTRIREGFNDEPKGEFERGFILAEK